MRVQRFDTDLVLDSTNADGTFAFRLSANDKGIYTLYAGRNMAQVFLAPGDSIHIAINMDEAPATWSFDADKHKEAQLLYDTEQLAAEKGMKDFPGPWALDYQAYSAKRDSVASAVDAALAQAIAQGGMDADFVQALELLRTNYALQFDLMYPTYYGYFNEDPTGIAGYNRDAVMERIATIEVKGPLAFELGSIKNILEAKLENHMEEAMEALEHDPDFEMSEQTYYELSYNAPREVFDNALMVDFFTFEQYRQVLSFGGPNRAEPFREDFRSRTLPPDYTDVIRIIEERWEPIMPGQPVPDFGFTDKDGARVQLSDFRGKLVYIDLWATWCGPCIMEHPHWESLKEQYADAPVAFVAISIDNSPDPWVKMLADKSMDGNHLYAKGAWASDIAQHFNVNSIPRFLLIDAEGKVLDPNADRPSTGIKAVLDSKLADLNKI